MPWGFWLIGGFFAAALFAGGYLVGWLAGAEWAEREEEYDAANRLLDGRGKSNHWR